MAAFPGAVFAKTGAEGVYCAALPHAGLGVAVKIDDGASRASEVATAGLLAAFGALDPVKIAAFSRRTLKNWNGAEVGEIRLAGPLGGFAPLPPQAILG